MRGDLHHLFTCESGCNSFRGNTPYCDFVDFEEAVRDACGKRETGGHVRLIGFEPEQGKGEVARATFYFLLRYPGEIAGSGGGVEFQHGAAEDPVGVASGPSPDRVRVPPQPSSLRTPG